MKIKNIDLVSNRIKQAIKNKEKIVLYGDADLDGTSSVIILKEAIEELGGKIFDVYFPDREKEGYGINEKALKYIKNKLEEKNALLIVLDCGITNFSEAEIAKKMGFELIIIDHHQPLDELPNASIIVDPKQPGDEYPFKNFANTGLSFRLAEEMLRSGLLDSKRKSFLELTALATIADMMIQEEDNKIFIDKGLETLLETKRLGLRVLLDDNNIDNDLLIRDVAQKMVSALNAADIDGHKTESYILLTSENDREAKKLAKELVNKSIQKQKRVKDLTEKAIDRLSSDDLVVFDGGSDWEIALLGATASKVCQRTGKPVFLYSKAKENSRGAVRVPPGMNAVEIMQESARLLEAFGGHPPAAGFSIKNENIEAFKKDLIKYFNNL